MRISSIPNLLPLPLSLLVHLLHLATPSHAACYTPNGTDRNVLFNATDGSNPYRPCLDTTSMCCSTNGDSCTKEGLCFNPGSNIYWRESCTDPTWQDPACVKLFVNGTGFNGTTPQRADDGSLLTDVVVTSCDDKSWCYGANNRGCCSRHEGYFIVNGTQTKQNPNAATSSTSSSTASGSSSPTSTSSSAAPSASPVPTPSGLSTGAKAGIGVGISLGALLLLAAVTWFLRRRRRGSHQSPDSEVVQPEGHEPSLMAPKKSTSSHPPELEAPRIEEKKEMYAGRASPPLPRELPG